MKNNNKKKVFLRYKVVLIDVNISPNENLRVLVLKMRRIYLRLRFWCMLCNKKMIRLKNKIMRFIGKANALLLHDIYVVTLFVLSIFGLSSGDSSDS